MKKQKLSLIFYSVALGLAVVSLFLIFADYAGVYYSIQNRTVAFSGFNSVFGGNDGDLLFSFMNLLPCLFIIASIVLLILRLVKVFKSEKIVDFIIAGCFLVAGILFCFGAQFLVFNNIYSNFIKINNLKKVLCAGAIISIVLSFLGAIIILLNRFWFVVDLLKNKINSSKSKSNEKENTNEKAKSNKQVKQLTKSKSQKSKKPAKSQIKKTTKQKNKKK